MSYDLSLTRGNYAWENAGVEIAPFELRELMAGDRSLRGELIDGELVGLRWGGHPDGDTVVFRLADGNLVASDPDRPTVSKLVDMATRLRGRVLGDDGERYARDGSWTHPAAGAGRVGGATQDRRQFFRGLFDMARQSVRATPARPNAPFHKGDRVRDTAGNVATVLGIEYVNGGGLNVLVTRFPDGRLVKRALRTTQDLVREAQA